MGHRHQTVSFTARPSSAPAQRTKKLMDSQGKWVQPTPTSSAAQEQAAARAQGEPLPIGAIVSFADKSPRAADAESHAWAATMWAPGQQQDAGGSSSQAISSNTTVSASAPEYKPAPNMQGTYTLQPQPAATGAFGTRTARGSNRRPYSATYRSDTRYTHPVVLESELYDVAFDPKVGRPVGSFVAVDGQLWSTATGKVPSAGASLNDDLVKRSYQATSRKLPVAQSYYFTNKRGVSLDPPTTEWEVRSLYKTQAFEAEQQKRLAQAASTAGIRGLQKTLHYVDANTLQRTMQASGQLASTYGGSAPLSAHDLARSQPWSSPALGRQTVPGANSTKYVGSQWRYIPFAGQLRDGHAIMTTSYI